MPGKRKRTSLSWFRWSIAWVWILYKDNLYVDNIITGCDTDEHALGYYEQSRSIMVNAAFNLRSWASNSQPLQNQTTVDGVLDTEPCYTNILGPWWDTTSDTLTLASKDVSLRRPTGEMLQFLIISAAILKVAAIFDNFCCNFKSCCKFW